MRNSRLRQGLLLASLIGAPWAAVQAQAVEEEPPPTEPSAAEGVPGAEPAAPDVPTADATPTPAPAEGAEETEAEDGGLEGAITDPGQLTDEELLSADPDLLIDPLPRRPPTGIFGRIVDAGTGEPLYAEVPVVIVEGNSRQYSTTDGFFVFRVGPGSYTLRSFFDGFLNATVPEVLVRRGQVTEVVIRLDPDRGGRGDVGVIDITAERGTVARRLEERQQAAAVSDGFTAEEISQSGDSNADQAVRRVVGITTDKDGYLFVRGLGGRYVNTLIDDSPFPSTDPNNPGVRLTLFPSSVLSGLNVFKTFTADLPASMAGGLLQIETRSYPSKFTVHTSLGLGVNTETTFGQVPTYNGGGLDWLGFDDGTRALPSALESQRLPLYPEPANLTLSRQFPADYALRSRTALPAISVGVDVGDTVLVGDRFLGYFLAFGYSYDEQQLTGEQVGSVLPDPTAADVCQPAETRPNCPNVVNENYTRNSNEVETTISGIGNLTLEIADDQTLRYTTIYSRASNDYTSFQAGLNNQDNEQFVNQRFRYTEEQAWWNQLRGTHDDLIGDVDLDWRVNVAVASRDQPDIREIGYRGIDGETPRFFGRNPNEGQRIYTALDQTELGGALDLAIPLPDGLIKVGAFANGFDRGFQLRRFQNRALNQANDPDLTLPPGELFTVERIGENYVLNELTREQDSYNAEQRNYAAYAHLDTELFVNWLRLVAGVRGEVFRQSIETDPTFAGEDLQPDRNVRTDVDVLPSVNLVFRAYEASASSSVPGTMQVRAGYSQTLARPLIRELAPFAFPDFVRNSTVTGNPDLRRTLVQSFDLRWEWFFSATEVLAVTGFVKLFEDPIERTVVGTNNQFGFQNIDQANNYGIELEGRLDLQRFARPLEGLAIGTNLTFVRSEVRFDRAGQGLATNFERPMAGQSPYVVNVSLAWDPDEIPLSLALFYNVFGERITEVGSEGRQDIYQQPFHTLNFTAQWDVNELLDLKLTLKNLLFSEQEFLQDGIVVYAYSPGMDAKISLGLTFD